MRHETLRKARHDTSPAPPPSPRARSVGRRRRPARRARAAAPSCVPARDETYSRLSRRFRDDDTFRRTRQGRLPWAWTWSCSTPTTRHGLVVASTEDSVFAVKMTDYAKRTGGEGKAAERVLHALAHLGAATLGLPTPGRPRQPRLRRPHHRQRRGGVRARGRPPAGRGRRRSRRGQRPLPRGRPRPRGRLAGVPAAAPPPPAPATAAGCPPPPSAWSARR